MSQNVPIISQNLSYYNILFHICVKTRSRDFSLHGLEKNCNDWSYLMRGTRTIEVP